MQAIVAVDANWSIGRNGKLLESIPEDMKFFKDKTIGKVVVMGRETFESLPHKSPLKDRVNIVLSRNKAFNNETVIVCRTIEEALLKIQEYNSEDIYIIGGEMIYNQFLPYCKKVYVTKIKNEYLADRKFPNLDNNSNWELINQSEVKKYKDIEFTFLTYANKSL